MQEDAEGLFKEILDINPEKYVFYQVAMRLFDTTTESISINNGSCIYIYNESNNEGIFNQINGILLNGEPLIKIDRENGVISYENSIINASNIVNNLPGTVENKILTKFTFYYREL